MKNNYFSTIWTMESSLQLCQKKALYNRTASHMQRGNSEDVQETPCLCRACEIFHWTQCYYLILFFQRVVTHPIRCGKCLCACKDRWEWISWNYYLDIENQPRYWSLIKRHTVFEVRLYFGRKSWNQHYKPYVYASPSWTLLPNSWIVMTSYFSFMLKILWTQITRP